MTEECKVRLINGSGPRGFSKDAGAGQGGNLKVAKCSVGVNRCKPGKEPKWARELEIRQGFERGPWWSDSFWQRRSATEAQTAVRGTPRFF